MIYGIFVEKRDELRYTMEQEQEDYAVNNKMKQICRRLIRVLMVLLGVFLLLVGLIIPMVNNGIALRWEKRLKALPLPAETVLVDSYSAAGRYDGSGEGVRYFGAVLLQSTQTLEQLQAYYAAAAPDCVLALQAGQTISCVGSGKLRFRTEPSETGSYILYVVDRSAHPGQGWLNLDIRGE